MNPPLAVRRTVVVMALLGLVGTCDDEAGGYEKMLAFAPEYARAACQRVFSCCTDADRAATRHLAFASESECADTMERSIRSLAQTVKSGLSVFDPDEGRRCLATLAGADCRLLFTRWGVFEGCDNIVHGWGTLGTACDNTDALCASNWCHEDVCAARPACVRGGGCPAGQFCDAATSASTFGCIPARPRGAACRGAQDECGATGRCREGVCVDALADGEACQLLSDCVGTCNNVTTGTPAGTCRPALCQGISP